MIRETAKSIPYLPRPEIEKKTETGLRVGDTGQFQRLSQDVVPLSPSREMYIRRKEEKWTKTSSAFQDQASSSTGGKVGAQVSYLEYRFLCVDEFLTVYVRACSTGLLSSGIQIPTEKSNINSVLYARAEINI